MQFLVPIDLGKNELRNAVVQVLASDPSSPVQGQIYFNSTDKKMKQYDGTVWVEYGVGDVSSNTSTSVDGEVALFSGTTGKLVKRATGSGIAKLTSGVLGTATSGTDYAPATSGTSALKGNGAGGFSNATLNDVGGATADYSINSHKLTNLLDPTNPQDAATKNYVDGTIQGLQPKPTARVATTAALPTNTYANGTSGVGATLTASANGALSVDGVSVAVNDLVLVKNEATAANNGLYVVSQAGDGTHPYILTRHADMDQAAEFSGAFIPVGNAGTANANSLWLANPSGAITVGTTAIPFTQLNGATDLIQGAGISISGNTISIENSGVLTVTHGGTGAATLTGLVKGNGTAAMTAATAFTDYVSPGYATTIGDGTTTSFTITHSLGSRDVIVQIYDAATYVAYTADITRSTTSTVTVAFSVAPATNSIRVVVLRAV